MLLLSQPDAVLADHGILREGECRRSDFLLGVLVTPLKTRQPPHAHYDDGVAEPQLCQRSLCRDDNVNPETITHRCDRCGVAGVEARGEFPRCCGGTNLFGCQNCATNRTITLKHRIGNRKSEVFYHYSTFLRRSRRR